jgi:hypothetical protein
MGGGCSRNCNFQELHLSNYMYYTYVCIYIFMYNVLININHAI